ncbi:hypothetical protein PENCOP_c016G05573 [Penicillium coprophilum]|uniref:Amidase domain-containing protein n=1 Tax=Penicillium coprophilum TaxID=36646 RepID=A0A1V6U867_9EURO|nr:hypothetical protein PENCOP_c016G05573 [Penicillium coprophilum]
MTSRVNVEFCHPLRLVFTQPSMLECPDTTTESLPNCLWQFDPSALFSPWRTVVPKPTLRLGLIQEDSHFPPHPPVLRTLTRATEKLQAAGNEIVPLDALLIRDIAASGEPTIPALASTSLDDGYMPYGYASLTLEGLYNLNEERNCLKEEFRNLIMQAKVDAIVMPGYQGTAQPHDMFGFVPYLFFGM